MANVWLHYIGKHLYTKKKFIKEAKELGVSRAVPRWLIGKYINLGDKVYLAFHKKDRRSLKEKAIVFAFFIVAGFQFDIETAQILEDEGVGKVKYEGRGLVKRGCGSYIHLGTFEVQDKEKFLKVLREEAKKVFLIGKIIILDEEKIIENMPFTRGYIKLKDEVEERLEYYYDFENNVIDDYERKLYKTKKRRNRNENKA